MPVPGATEHENPQVAGEVREAGRGALPRSLERWCGAEAACTSRPSQEATVALKVWVVPPYSVSPAVPQLHLLPGHDGPRGSVDGDDQGDRV